MSENDLRYTKAQGTGYFAADQVSDERFGALACASEFKYIQ
jgi:hypothetical protein